jgi:hypothetical protein
MRPLTVLLLSAAVPFLFATAAYAQIAHVPLDYPTIQGAINAGATTVYVSAGNYPEVLTIQRTVTLLPDPPADARNETPFPVVKGMNIFRNATDYPMVTVRGFHFTDVVTQTNTMVRWGITTLEGCKLDGGFWTYGSSGLDDAIKIRSCVITGNVYVYSYFTDFTGNMLWKGQADIHSNGGNGAIIRDNLVIGPSTAGLLSTSSDNVAEITGNMVVGVGTGISLVNGTASRNDVQDCVTGFASANAGGGGGGGRMFLLNSTLRCGTGIDVTQAGGGATVRANVVDSSEAVGIHIGPSAYAIVAGNRVRWNGSHGIWSEGGNGPDSNAVLYSGGDGIRSAELVEYNVVGRSGGHGIVAPEARHNTSFSNAGSGLVMNGAAPDTIENNISYGNTRYGIAWSGTGTPLLRCNDWFGNISGATSGVSAGGTDLAVNPLFCDLPSNNIYLSSASPVLNPARCGLMGARGQGCTSPVSVTPPIEEAAPFAVHPNPARGTVEMRWARSGTPSRIQVFDVAGALRYETTVPAEVNAFHWQGADGVQRKLPGGVYFVRRASGAVTEHARLVLAP